ncbi:hypothetical protein [Streptomyces sp. FIT100]|uniref:hypothetical protein n=1 Tax=Streptomyces sp. FIT100 TaxID=2837956 RepID=UPI0021CA459F|nr:hypothetical protein [Streptomyces sp. FIT100]
MDAGDGDVGGGAGLDVGDAKRGAVRGGQELNVAIECLVFLAVPQVIAVVADTGEEACFGESAVEDHVGHALASALVQDLVQVRGVGGEDVDAFMQGALVGGLGYAGVAGQAVDASAESAQHQHGFVERVERAANVRSADSPPVC